LFSAAPCTLRWYNADSELAAMPFVVRYKKTDRIRDSWLLSSPFDIYPDLWIFISGWCRSQRRRRQRLSSIVWCMSATSRRLCGSPTIWRLYCSDRNRATTRRKRERATIHARSQDETCRNRALKWRRYWISIRSQLLPTRRGEIRYDTIRDAILTCARKPTWVSLIYRTEPTTKKCKTEKKTKSRKQICSEITVNSPANPRSKYLSRRKEKLQREGFAEKEGFKPGKKEWVGDGIPNNSNMTVGR